MKLADAKPGTVIGTVGYRNARCSANDVAAGRSNAYVVVDVVEVPAAPSLKSYRRAGERPTVKKILARRLDWDREKGTFTETTREERFAPAKVNPIHESRVKAHVEATLREISIRQDEADLLKQIVAADLRSDIARLAEHLDTSSDRLCRDWEILAVRSKTSGVKMTLTPEQVEIIVEALNYEQRMAEIEDALVDKARA